MDAYDQQILGEENLTNSNLLLNYTPTKSLEKTLFSKKEIIKENIREKLRNRELNSLNLVEYLSLVSETEKLKEYYQKLYEKNKNIPLYI